MPKPCVGFPVLRYHARNRRPSRSVFEPGILRPMRHSIRFRPVGSSPLFAVPLVVVALAVGGRAQQIEGPPPTTAQPAKPVAPAPTVKGSEQGALSLKVAAN